MENTESYVIKIWKTRSHMENTESDVIKIWKTRSLTSEKNMENTESYGKHGVHHKIWKTRSLTSEKNMENTESGVLSA